MGRGRKPTRGGRRQFTDVETLQKEAEDEKRKQSWRAENAGDISEEDGDDLVVNRQGAVGDLPPSESESESEEEGADSKKSKAPAVSGSSNKQPVKNKKIADLTLESLQVDTNEEDTRGLNRKEREAVAKEEAKRRYQAATAAGKTDEARADLARLAIIRKEREIAAKRREEEQKAKEAASKAKADSRAKAQGRR